MSTIELIQKAVNLGQTRISKKLANRKRLNKIETAATTGKGYFIDGRIVWVYDTNYRTGRVEPIPFTSFKRY